MPLWTHEMLQCSKWMSRCATRMTFPQVASALEQELGAHALLIPFGQVICSLCIAQHLG